MSHQPLIRCEFCFTTLYSLIMSTDLLTTSQCDTTADELVDEFTPLPLSDNDSTLLWKMDDTRDMVVKQRLWPSFVGAKKEVPSGVMYGNSKTKEKVALLLPVLLWPEQKRYLEEKGFSNLQEGNHRYVIKGVEPTGGDDGDESTFMVTADDHKKARKRKQKEITKDEEKSLILKEEEKSSKKIRRGDEGFFASWKSWFKGMCNSPLYYMGYKLTNAEHQYIIYRECKRLKYFIGPGDVYGGNYNIYEGGDPSSHSTATIRVVRKLTITGRDLLSFSRVQHQVAKSAVFAYVDPVFRKAEFLVVNFRNVSERI